ncbi:MAG: Fe-S cluster assembly protein SufD [Cyanobacteria bacterium P01_D01_bin.14]
MTLSTSAKTADARRAYLKQLLALAEQGAARSQLPLPDLRRAATAMVHEQSFPSTRDEQWRFTDLSSLLPLTLTLPTQEITTPLPDALPDGVRVSWLSELLTSSDIEALTARLGQVPGSNEVFTALNTAGFTDAVVVWVTKNQRIADPIQLTYSFPVQTEPALTQPRCLVVVESGASLTLVEQFAGDGTGLSNAVTEIWVEDNAEMRHVRLQQHGDQPYHVGKTAVSQARDSRYHCTAIDLGARLSRHHLEVYQRGTQTETHLHGLSMVQGDQLADTHSLIALSHPHGHAEQVQKNIVSDRGHAVFNGKIYVPQAAQMTDAAQLNRNLLLSDKGRVDTKPELDIVADNVKCAHGATVSQLQPEQLFYLQSRGISQTQAQQLLVRGFAMEVVETIPETALRDRIAHLITQWTP